jgi:uncharacterized protein (TIGR02145 family)
VALGALREELECRGGNLPPAIFNLNLLSKGESFFMNGNICRKSILKTASIAIFAVLFYTVCDDNGVKVVTPEVTTFVDYRDNKTYKKVQIGSQIWMAENLKYEADGSKCYGEDGNGTFSILEPNPDGTPNSWIVKTITLREHCDIYGRLYDWNTAMDGEHSSSSNPSGVEGVCPAGWHIPSDAEWQVLIDYVEPNAGTKLKSREFRDDVAPSGTPSPNGTDKYRFAALPGPMASRWWSSTERDSDEEKAGYWSVTGQTVGVWHLYADKHASFFSVRCVHD